MKTKTVLQWLALSASIYQIAKDTNLIEKLESFTNKEKGNINDDWDSPLSEEEGESQFFSEILLKSSQLKEELEQKIEEMVAEFYKKVNIAHLNEVKILNEKVEKSDMAIALLEARLNHLESKK